MLGWVFAPVAWLIGVPWDEAAQAGTYIGEKTVVVTTFALAGFANFASSASRSARSEGSHPSAAGRWPSSAWGHCWPAHSSSGQRGDRRCGGRLSSGLLEQRLEPFQVLLQTGAKYRDEQRTERPCDALRLEVDLVGEHRPASALICPDGP